MKTFTLAAIVLFACLQCLITSAQTYTIPWAQQQPAWVFPIWFEDSSGAKDTLYFNYDPTADSLFNQIRDTIFGDIKIPLDTSIFQATYNCFVDSELMVNKSITYNSTTIEYGTNFCVFNCVFPLKIKWDPSLFRSDTLPFPNQYPSPRVQGLIGYSDPAVVIDSILSCDGSWPILITDSIISSLCYAIDSILIGGGYSIFSFHIVPWSGYYDGIKHLDNSDFIKVFVTDDLIELRNYDGSFLHYEIYNINGQLCLKNNCYYSPCQINMALD